MGSVRRTCLFCLALVTCLCIYYGKPLLNISSSLRVDREYQHDYEYSSFTSRDLSTAAVTDDHAAVTSGDDFVTAQHGLFGGLAHLKPENAALSFLMVVGSVVTLEHLFHEIHTVTHDTPFADMVSAIEKELMIVGFMALTFKVVIATTYFITQDWLHPFEMYDIIIPITSFMFCMQGFLLIIQSIKNVETWRKAYHLHLFEILDEFYEIYFDKEFNEMPWYNKLDFNAYEDNDPNKPYFSLWAGIQSVYELMIFQYQYYTHHNPCLQVIVRWIPYLSPRIYGEMEFRILHSAFCEAFMIQHDAMPFDEYVRRVIEKEILNLITIDPGNWVVIMILGLVNTYRTTTFSGDYPPHCDKYLLTDDAAAAAGGHRLRMLQAAHAFPPSYQECVDKEALLDYFFIGLLMLLLNIVLFAFARFYEFRIMRRFDVWSIAHYAPYLQKTETVGEHKRKEAGRLSASELKQVLNTAKEKILFHNHTGHRHSGHGANGHGHSAGDHAESWNPLTAFRSAFKYRSVLDTDASETGMIPKLKHFFFGKTKDKRDKKGADLGSPNLRRGLSFRGGLKSPSGSKAGVAAVTPRRESPNMVSASKANSSSPTNVSGVDSPQLCSPISQFPGGSPMPPTSSPPVQNIQEAPVPVAYGSLVTEPPVVEKTGLTPEKDPELDVVPIHEKKKKKHHKRNGHESVHDHEDSEVDEHAKDNLKDNFISQLTEEEENADVSRGLSFTQPLNSLQRKLSVVVGKVLPIGGDDGGDIGHHGHGHDGGLYGNAGRMKGVFLYEKDSYFFDMVDHMMMIISFYLALWIVNYGTVAYKLPTEAHQYQLLTIAPAIASTLFYLMTVRSACLLKAVTTLDADVLENTLEDAETAKMLGLSVRRKILHKLHINKYGERMDKPHSEHKDHHMTDEDIKHCEEELRALFDSIDTDGSGLLSRSEFKFFLGELHISFSHKRWRQIFREMDRNYDDQISFDELFLFLFPDHDEALAREVRRLKIVGDRVRNHGKLHGHHHPENDEVSGYESSPSPSKMPSFVPEPVGPEPLIMAESGSFKVSAFKDFRGDGAVEDIPELGSRNKVVLKPISSPSIERMQDM